MTRAPSRGAAAENRRSAVPCTLCGGAEITEVLSDRARTYYACGTCSLIFLHPDDRLLPLQEVLRYLEHRNDRADPGYVAFLSRLVDPVCERVPVGARGLDFGCGPTPVIAELLTAAGRPTAAYDPLFHPDESALLGDYDFITCSEVVEHAHHPASLFERLTSLLRPDGTLAVMTRFYGLEAPFAEWWYRRDPTHVSFYDARTMSWIAHRFGCRLELPVANVAVFRRG